jgi:hypothetical protein
MGGKKIETHLRVGGGGKYVEDKVSKSSFNKKGRVVY